MKKLFTLTLKKGNEIILDKEVDSLMDIIQKLNYHILASPDGLSISVVERDECIASILEHATISGYAYDRVDIVEALPGDDW